MERRTLTRFGLRRFDVAEDLTRDCAFVAIGKRRTGKSTLMRDVAFRLRDRLPRGLVFNGTKESVPFYRRFVPDDKISSERLELCLIADMLEDPEGMVLESTGENDPHFFVLVEDCMHDKAAWRSREIRRLFERKEGRLFGVGMAYPNDLTPAQRQHVDVAFSVCRGGPNDTACRKVYDAHFSRAFAAFADFEAATRELAEAEGPFAWIVVDNRVPSDAPLAEKVFWYRADDPSEEGGSGRTRFSVGTGVSECFGDSATMTKPAARMPCVVSRDPC